MVPGAGMMRPPATKDMMPDTTRTKSKSRFSHGPVLEPVLDSVMDQS